MSTEEESASSEILNTLCYLHPKHNILSLRRLVGDRVFTMILDKYGGLYVRFPTVQNTANLASDVRLALLYQNVREKYGVYKLSINKTPADLQGWNDAEARFLKYAERLGLTYEKAKKRAKETLKTMTKARAWIEELENWDRNRKREP